MRRFVPVLVMAFVLCVSVQAEGPEDGWVNLFNGKNLDGWVQRGGKAKYRVENEEIIGSSVPNTSNSFLCTKKDYGDFILELEFKVDPVSYTHLDVYKRQGKGRLIDVRCAVLPNRQAVVPVSYTHLAFDLS